jgi:hypothetical protein
MAWEPYTEQQWLDLTDAAPQIARAIASVSGSAAQSEAELDAFLTLVQETRDARGSESDSTLLMRLVTDVHGRLAGGGMSTPETDAMTDGLQAARRAGALLAIYPDASQAREVRLWLLDAARRVAGSARDGGVLGLGGTQISSAENDTLLAISDALGLSESAEG